MEYPKYSVLMSVYKNDSMNELKEAIESMLTQTVLPDDFVIVEDGPISEENEALIESFVKRYPQMFQILKKEENEGLGPALRDGIQLCRNNWVARMDADDYSMPKRIEKQLIAAYENHADIVGCNAGEFSHDPYKFEHIKAMPEKHDEIIAFSKKRTPFVHPAVLFKKSHVLKAGNYQEAYLHEDYDLFVRLLIQGDIGYNVQEPLVRVRVSPDFYNRRGGTTYLKALLAYNKRLLKMKWSTPKDYVIRSGANIISCLVPGKVRALIYEKILRK